MFGNIDRGGILQQWYAMGKAKNLEEFRRALDINGLTYHNVMYADQAGNSATAAPGAATPGTPASDAAAAAPPGQAAPAASGSAPGTGTKSAAAKAADAGKAGPTAPRPGTAASATPGPGAPVPGDPAPGQPGPAVPAPGGENVASDVGVTASSIKLGHIGIYSGPVGSFGDDLSYACRATLQSVNDTGGINGRKLDVLVRDDGWDGTKGMNAARDLAEREKVFGFACIQSVSAPYQRPSWFS